MGFNIMIAFVVLSLFFGFFLNAGLFCFCSKFEEKVHGINVNDLLLGVSFSA